MDHAFLAALNALVNRWCYGQFEPGTIAPISPDQQREDGLELKDLMEGHGYELDMSYAAETIAAPGPLLAHSSPVEVRPPAVSAPGTTFTVASPTGVGKAYMDGRLDERAKHRD
jgi:hypothetical protein